MSETNSTTASPQGPRTFNTDQAKWDRQCVRDLAKPYRGAILQITESGAVGNGIAMGAQFASRDEAKAVLLAAGYVEVKPWQFKARASRLSVFNRVKAESVVSDAGGVLPKIGKRTIIAQPKAMGGGMTVVEKLGPDHFLIY